MSRFYLLAAGFFVVAGCVKPQNQPVEDTQSWRQVIERRIENIQSGEITPVLLHQRQQRSADYALYDATSRCQRDNRIASPDLPDDSEIEAYLSLRDESSSSAFDYLDELYFNRDDLKALSVRDSDGDSMPDYRVSDYFGKFMEGDVDIDGDGVRNTLDPAPYDVERATSGNPSEGDANSNGVPDHVDLSYCDDHSGMATIQTGLLRDYNILLLERNRRFDLRLARAVDDAVRRVYRAYYEQAPIMPTLRTIAVEDTALIGPIAAAYMDDHTSAQVFSQNQSLTVYDEGRSSEYDIALLGLLVHEMAHSYHMALDFDETDLAGENMRSDFPADEFITLIEPFEWVVTGYYDERITGSAPIYPHYAYVGMAGPEFEFHGKSPAQWESWVLDQYYALDEDPDYLKSQPFADLHIVGDYSLTSPYEWYADNMLAYVVMMLEHYAMDELQDQGADTEEINAARQQIDRAMRSVWSDFYHRNIDPELFAYFADTFPISFADQAVLAHRYINPILNVEPN